MSLSASGEAVARMPGRPRGHEVRYVVEARDAAGLVVTLPKGADEGKHYTVRFQGKSSRILGGISWFSALAAALLFLGAGAAGLQAYRGRMSPGPAALLGAIGAAFTVFGLLGIGAIHAFRVVGSPWPGDPVLLALSRGDLGLITLLWAANLFLGRGVLLDEEPAGETGVPGRPFALAAVAGGVLTVVFAVF
jgi:hypothetical protein